MTSLRLGRLLVGGAITVTATFAAAALPADAAPPPAQGCSSTLVVVEWRDAPNSPPGDNGISGGCGTADPNPVDVLQNAGFSPTFETLTSKILCAIYLSPGAQCKGMPTNAYWSYWVVNPQTGSWEEQSYDADEATPDAGHPAPNVVHPAAAAAPAPPIEDWVYQSNHVVGKPDAPPAYPATGNPPPSSTPTAPSSAPSYTPSSGPTSVSSTGPTGSQLPSVPPSARLPQVKPTPPQATASRAVSSPSARHSTAATNNGPADSGEAAGDGDYVAAPPAAPTSTDPNLPGAPIPGTWSLSPSGTPPTDLARAGRASKAAWATGDSAHRVAWSTGLGIGAVALLGVGVAAQLRRRRTSLN